MASGNLINWTLHQIEKRRSFNETVKKVNRSSDGSIDIIREVYRDILGEFKNDGKPSEQQAEKVKDLLKVG